MPFHFNSNKSSMGAPSRNMAWQATTGGTDDVTVDDFERQYLD
jgi:hypothetical protein